MQLINRYRATVVLIAVFALVGAGMFAVEAYAGPNCGAKSASTKSACTSTNTATVQKASADSKSCSKEECLAKMMASGMTKADAEAKFAAYSKGSCSKSNASLASAKSGCSSKTTASLASAKSGCSKSAGATTASASGKACCASKTTASLASAKSGCSSKASASLASQSSGCSSKSGATATVSLASAKSQTCDKEACIAKCMKEKNISRAEAEACWAKCQQGLASGKTCHGDAKATATVASSEASAPSITSTVSGGTQ